MFRPEGVDVRTSYAFLSLLSVGEIAWSSTFRFRMKQNSSTATSPAVKPLYALPSVDCGRDMILAPLLNSIFSAATEKSSPPLERSFAASANLAAFRIISCEER